MILTKNKKKILINIDDGFKSFYNEAWPYLKENKIPFIFSYLQNLLEKMDI